MTENASAARDSAPSLSVVVCTYNRAQLVGRALTHIGAAATRAGIGVEVIVVDNNSRDATKEAVARAAATAGVPIRYVFEPKQGLSFARNRGLRSAGGDVVAFTDDDCLVERDWIAALWREFEANPDVAVVGGSVDLYSSDDRPISIRRVAERVRYTSADQIYGLIMGANLAVRRGIAERIGGFDPAFGGSRGVVADDIEFVYRALKRGFGVVYTPEARVLHDHGRRTADDVRTVGRSYVRGRGAFFCKYLLRADPTILRHAWWEVRASGSTSDQGPNALSRSETLRALASGALHFILTRTRIIRP
jgi:glycosyltransferase involved in cell wall biosynthesis